MTKILDHMHSREDSYRSTIRVWRRDREWLVAEAVTVRAHVCTKQSSQRQPFPPLRRSSKTN